MYLLIVGRMCWRRLILQVPRFLHSFLKYSLLVTIKEIVNNSVQPLLFPLIFISMAVTQHVSHTPSPSPSKGGISLSDWRLTHELPLQNRNSVLTCKYFELVLPRNWVAVDIESVLPLSDSNPLQKCSGYTLSHGQSIHWCEISGASWPAVSFHHQIYQGHWHFH